MQVLNQNSSSNSKIGPSLPKPTLPQSQVAKTNTPVKVPLASVDNKQTAVPQNTFINKSTMPSASQTVPNLVNQIKPNSNTAVSLPPTVASPSFTPSKTQIITTEKEKFVPTEQIGKKNNKKDNKKDKKKDKKKNNSFEDKENKKSGKKKIPTILGLLILIVSLVAGVLLFGNGTGLFTPRATPETTPKNIVVSNLTNKSFTVSFYTDEETIAFIKYGASASDIKQQANDDRDQLSGVIKPYRLHHITVRGLEPNKDYYYLLGTGGKTTFDDAGNPYQIKTASSQSSVSPNNQTIYGTVSQKNGQPGEGAIVFVTLEGAGVLSTLVKSSGSWAVSLANAYNLSLNAYPDVKTDSTLSIKVQGIELNSITNRVMSVASAQPVPEIVMGQEASENSEELSATREELLADNSGKIEDFEKNVKEEKLNDASPESEIASISPENFATTLETEEIKDNQQIETAALNDSDRTLDLDEIDETSAAQDNIIITDQPIIKANLPANVTVKIEINSTTAIETIAETDADGNLIIDVASLEKNLEPGEHTINYTYIDPNSGQEVKKSYNFTVSAPNDGMGRGVESETRTIASAEIAQALPHGTGNPYLPNRELTPVPTLTPTPSITPTEEATSSVRKAMVSTESGTYNAGSTFNTISLLAVGLFFIATGVWSFFLAKQFGKDS